MEEVAAGIEYAQFGHLSVERFQLLTRLVRYDLFSDGTNAQKASWLGVSTGEVGKMRRSKDYSRMSDTVRKTFIQVTTPKMFKEHLDDPATQDQLFRHMMRKGIYSDELKFSSRLLESLSQAAVPRALASTAPAILIVGDEHAQLIVDTLQEVKQLGQGTIDAEYQEVHPDEDAGDEGPGEE